MKKLEVIVTLLLVASCGTAVKREEQAENKVAESAIEAPPKTDLEIAQDELNSSKNAKKEDPAIILKHLTLANEKCSEAALPLCKEIKKALKSANKQKDQILSASKKIAAYPPAKIDQSFNECQKLKDYHDDFSEVKDVCEKRNQEFIALYLKDGEKHLDNKNSIKAKSAFEKVLKAAPDHKEALNGVSCAAIIEKSSSNDLRAAYALILDLKAKAPESACLLKFEQITLESLIKKEKKAAEKKESSKEIQTLLGGIDIYRYLLSLPAIPTDLKDEIPLKIGKIQTSVSKILIGKAEQLFKKDKNNAPLVYTMIKQAYRFSPETTNEVRPLFEDALAVLDEKRAFNTSIVINSGKDPIFTTFIEQIKGTLVAESQAIKPTFVAQFKDSVANRMPASEKKKIAPSDYTMTLKLTDYNAEEYGASQPFYQASKYISGTRQLDNPAWFNAEQEYQAAQAEYNQNYRYYEQQKANCNSMGNAFSVGMCQGMWSGLSSARVDNARAVYNSTPRFVQENIISDYTYRQYKVGVNLYLRVEETLTNNKTKKSLPAKIFEYKVVRKEGEILEGVQPTDQNNLRDGRYNVPDLAYEKSAGEKKIASDLQQDLKNVANTERGLRYCKTAKSASATSDQLCVLLTEESDAVKAHPDYKFLEEAKKRVEKAYPVTDEIIAQYARSSEELPTDSSTYFLAGYK